MGDTITWIDADSVEHDLTSVVDDISWLHGATGRFMPPVRLVEELVPSHAGGRLREAIDDMRTVDLPLIIEGATETAFRANLRTWLYRFHANRGDGKLKVTGPDGASRELTCRYVGGLEIAEQLGIQEAGWQRAIASFRAHDPYWYDSAETVATYTTGEPATFFPIFPITLSSSEVFAAPTVTNGGDVEAWPVWTITGPGVNPVLRNLTTGKSISLTRTLAAGDSIEIDTRPFIKTVKLHDGTNLFSAMSSTSALWPLAKGANSLQLEMSSATAASSLALSYRRRWLGA